MARLRASTATSSPSSSRTPGRNASSTALWKRADGPPRPIAVRKATCPAQFPIQCRETLDNAVRQSLEGHDLVAREEGMAAVDTALRRSSISPARTTVAPVAAETTAADVMAEIFDRQDRRERFIPVTRQAIMERLTRPHAWPGQQAAEARRFFRYLDYWRQQTYASRLFELEQDYEPFNPDSDLLVSRSFSRDERFIKRQRLIANMTKLLEQANYTRIDTDKVELILTSDGHYGLDLHVDLSAFDELLVFYRGAGKRTESRRNSRKLYLKNEEVDVPIFQRLCVVFKLKPEEVRIRE